MGSKHIFISHTADIAFDIQADTIEELFQEAFLVWFISVIDNKNIKTDDQISFKLKANSLEQLLVDFLNEVNFLLLVKKRICISISKIKIDKKLFKLYVEMNTKILSDEIELKEEIKSVTYHQMKVEKQNGKYSVRIVFDI